MSRVLLSRAARLDRRALTGFTVERFGVRQARRLRARFETVLSMLAESPLLGRTRQDLDPPGHSFRYFVVLKSFIIVYEPIDDGIRVARILHGGRGLSAELDRGAGQD